MSHVAKLFINGRRRAVRLPAAYRFDTKEVFIRKDPETGDAILSRRPETWDSFFRTIKDKVGQDSFLGNTERDQKQGHRDPFKEWRE
ncbi:antitoxin [Pollutimonas sp. M17]|uniref:antitoxin n=1 Tax=Pollutimonas sp. M17 TaxID=2962065 RepID=UPI0021F4D04F|nr:AbrB/MazE/SpoVT family DNA-binding domain-containing protein [Pollutimonas sp. M17]UYO93954.1 AbrB/MazE/SpoVT family DNA-binding domain-containing protein [Pollutimonas sp. M17]